MNKIVGICFCSLMIAIQIQASEINNSFESYADTNKSDQAVIQKSEADTSEYRYIKLPNQMKVLLVSDMEADKAAVSLDVFVGSSQDPIKRQGLAHFLEHMLFLGTDKYPTPDEYQSFISQHGGKHNAYTSFEHTNYFFDIDPVFFESALDRFSRFFIAPQFNSEYVDREMKAVHSEYMARIKNDYRRQRNAFSQIINQNHPAAKFSVGNFNILSNTKNGTVRKDLLDFYDEYYSANRMALVVLAPKSLDELESIVVARFEEVKNSNKPQIKHGQPLFVEGSLPQLLSIKPVQERRQLTITFPLVAMEDYYREKPLNYISSLIGDEGKGSLLSLLKEKGWAEALSAGEGLSDLSGSSFDISVALTSDGVKQWEKIVSLIFQEIKLISSEGIKKWRWLEQNTLANTAFRYKELDSPIQRVSQLAAQLQEYPPEFVIRGPYLNDLYDPQLIKKVLEAMKPSNALVTLISPKIKAKKITVLYKVPYGLKKIIAFEKINLDESLKLPMPNKFIPDDFKVRSITKKMSLDNPLLQANKENYRLWHYLDSYYKVPKAQFYASVKIRPIENAFDAAMIDLYLRVINERLNEPNYAASLAGLNYQTYRQANSIGIFVSGFDNKLPFLIEEVVKGLLTPVYEDKLSSVDSVESIDSLLERLRTELIREWKNTKKDSPYKQVIVEPNYLLDTTSWSPHELAEAALNFNKDKFTKLIDSLYDGATIDFLIGGNINITDAKLIAKNTAQRFSKKPYENPVNKKVYKIPSGEKLKTSLAIDHNDSAILRYYQGHNDSLKEAATMILIKQLISSDFFHELRTEQQLGYIVAVVDKTIDRVPGIGLLIQSPEAQVSDLEHAIDSFLFNFLSNIKNMPHKDFLQQKEAVLVRLREKPKNLVEHSLRFWKSITMHDYDFSRLEKLILSVQQLTHEDVLGAYDFLMVKSGYSLQINTGSKPTFDKKQFEESREFYNF